MTDTLYDREPFLAYLEAADARAAASPGPSADDAAIVAYYRACQAEHDAHVLADRAARRDAGPYGPLHREQLRLNRETVGEDGGWKPGIGRKLIAEAHAVDELYDTGRGDIERLEADRDAIGDRLHAARQAVDALWRRADLKRQAIVEARLERLALTGAAEIRAMAIAACLGDRPGALLAIRRRADHRTVRFGVARSTAELADIRAGVGADQYVRQLAYVGDAFAPRRDPSPADRLVRGADTWTDAAGHDLGVDGDLVRALETAALRLDATPDDGAALQAFTSATQAIHAARGGAA